MQWAVLSNVYWIDFAVIGGAQLSLFNVLGSCSAAHCQHGEVVPTSSVTEILESSICVINFACMHDHAKSPGCEIFHHHSTK